MGHKVRLRQRQPRTVAARRRACRAALSAAGVAPVAPLSSLDLAMLGPTQRFFYDEMLKGGLSDMGGDAWPCESDRLDDTGSVFRGDSEAVYRFGGTLAYVSLSGGWLVARVAAKSADEISGAMQAFRAAYPPAYLVATDEGDATVPITFWTNGQFGPSARLRRIEASPWQPIRGNYSAQVRDELDELMNWRTGPGREGQLLLWQGPPGTGKTWALRALASEWAPWAEFHYITDPDAFFVEQPSYMIDVLLSDSYEAISYDGDVYEEQKPESKWRVLILEDTGELLASNAKEKYGQGLSRLLNVVDGMIGQGLRVLALVTTNDELDSLNPATVRPGRCLSRAVGGVGPTVFGALSDEEAREWSGDPEAEAGSLAELYDRYGGRIDPLFADDDDEEPVEDRIAAVAEKHQPGEAAYGQTAWDADTKTVLWCCWDGTGNDEVAAAERDFLAISGVERFVYEAEGMPSGWCDAKVVYGKDSFDCSDSDAAARAGVEARLSALLDEVSAPLPPSQAPPAPLSVPASESRERASDEALAASYASVAEAHRQARTATQQALESSLEALRSFAAREQPAPVVHFHMPDHSLDVNVTTPPVEITTPPVTVEPAAVTVPVTVESPAITVQPAAVEVHVPAAAVEVHVPAQEPPHVEVTVERPKPVAMMVEYDEQGRKIYVPEEVE